MSTLRQALYGLALFSALALLLWGQQQRIKLADGDTARAIEREARANSTADRHRLTAETLRDTLNDERQAQARLRDTHNQLRQNLASRQRQIEDLKRENKDLNDWAARLLPDLARRLRERPALTGADAYRQWLSGRSAVPAASDPTGE